MSHWNKRLLTYLPSQIVILKQLVNAIWYKAALPRHTDSSVVLARCRECPIHVTRGSFRPPKTTHIPNDISIGWAVYSRFNPTSQVADMRPHVGHIGITWRIRLNSGFLRPSRVHNQNGKSMGSAIFAQLTQQFRPTHWCHLANTIELVHPSVNSSSKPKPQSDWAGAPYRDGVR